MTIRLSMEFGTWRECFDFVQGFPRINAAEGEEEEEVKEEKPVKKEGKEKAREVKEKAREVKEKSREVKEEPSVEELIVKTRAALREAVQKAGKNIAAEWVHEKGFESFRDIKDAEILKALLEKAGEYNAK